MVEWDDACTGHGNWCDVDKLKPTIALNFSVGYLVLDTDTHVVLALSVATGGGSTEVGDTITIPRAMVRRVRKL